MEEGMFSSSLSVYMGPMFSGKSSELIRQYGILSVIHPADKILIINHEFDNQRYMKNSVSTHAGFSIECLNTNVLDDVNIDYDVFMIEEAQFFKSLYEFVQKLLSLGKIIFVFGLSGDADQNLFGDMYKLLPIADRIVQLRALCMECKDGTPAPFTKRNQQDQQAQNQVQIGGSESYTPVCRRHL